MNELISIVVPIYKSEAYIANLINDVIAQTYSNWELILVSNGNNREEQEKIVKQYSLVDKRIILLSSNKAGTSIARNKGIENAKGKYLTFLDADDRITNKHLQLYLDATEDDIDIIIGGFSECSLDGEEYYYPMEEHNSVIEGTHFWDYYLNSHTGLQGVVWNKFYKMDILMKSGVRFHEDIVHIEDIVFNYELFLHSSRIKTIPMTGYKYIRRPDSITGRYTPSFENSLRVLRELYCKLCKKAGYEEKKQKMIITRRIYTDTYIIIINLFRSDCPIPFREKVKYVGRLMNDKNFINSKAFTDRLVPKKQNLKIFAFFVMLNSPFIMSIGYTILFFIRKIYLSSKFKIANS